MADPLRLLLVDDEPLAVRRLELALRDLPEIEVVGSARDGESALDEVRRLRPDLIFLDVEMPKRTGLSAAAELQSDRGPDIIILSAFDRYASLAFEVEALDYLLKPVQPERLRQALDRARRRRDERASHVSTLASRKAYAEATLHVPNRHGGRDVPLSDIVWIEAARDYALLHTRTRSHIIRTTMSALAKALPTDSVLRVHRSAFVTLLEVRRWGVPAKGVHSLILSDGTEVAVGPSYLAETRAALRFLD